MLITISKNILFHGFISTTNPIMDNEAEVDFEGFIPAGKYDMTAISQDGEGRMSESFIKSFKC